MKSWTVDEELTPSPLWPTLVVATATHYGNEGFRLMRYTCTLYTHMYMYIHDIIYTCINRNSDP